MKKEQPTVTKNKVTTNAITSLQYSCSKCQKTFPRKDGLQAHIRRVHGLDMSANSPKNMTRVKSGPGGQKRNNKSALSQYQCFVCPKKFSQNMVLRYHMREHTGENHYYSCVVCTRKFFLKTDLQQHMGEHPGITNVYTYVPPLIITERNYYTYDLTNKIQCKLCAKKFVLERNFKDHMTRHSEDEPLMFSG